jgi:thioester reductase-like protein
MLKTRIKRNRIRNFVQNLKSGPCYKCGGKFHFSAMEFDVQISLHKMYTVSTKTILNKIRKHHLICANCNSNKFNQNVQNTCVSNKLVELTNWLNSIKDNRRCSNCGHQFRYWSLNFDHRNQKKKFKPVSQMKNSKYSKEKIILEIEKCDLICVNCHRIKIWKQHQLKIDQVKV